MNRHTAFLWLLLAVFLPSLRAAPVAPGLTSPGTANSPGSTLPSFTPTFLWQPAATAVRYNLSISTAGGTEIYSFTSTSAATSHLLPAGVLLGSGSYFWVVRARDSSNAWGPNSSRLYFKAPGTATTAPSVPVPTSPGVLSPPGMEVTSQTPTFDWALSAGASVYGLQILRADTGTSVYATSSIASPTTQLVSPVALTAGVSYYWQVRAINGIGSSNWSAARYFVIAIPPPPAPELISPGTATAPGSVVRGDNVSFSWSGSGISYEIAVYPAEGAAPVWGAAQVMNQSVSIPVSLLGRGAALVWRVRGRSGTTPGSVGPWSSYYYFRTAWHYADWVQAAGFSADQTGYQPGDAPGGGVPNLLRYAFGGNVGSTTPPAPELVPAGAGRAFRLPLRDDAGDASVVVEASEDGTSWTTIAAGITVPGDIALGPVWSTKTRAIFRAQVSLVP